MRGKWWVLREEKRRAPKRWPVGSQATGGEKDNLKPGNPVVCYPKLHPGINKHIPKAEAMDKKKSPTRQSCPDAALHAQESSLPDSCHVHWPLHSQQQPVDIGFFFFCCRSVDLSDVAGVECATAGMCCFVDEPPTSPCTASAAARCILQLTAARSAARKSTARSRDRERMAWERKLVFSSSRRSRLTCSSLLPFLAARDMRATRTTTMTGNGMPTVQ